MKNINHSTDGLSSAMGVRGVSLRGGSRSASSACSALLLPTRSYLFPLVHTCSYLFPLSRTLPRFFLLVRTFSHLSLRVPPCSYNFLELSPVSSFFLSNFLDFLCPPYLLQPSPTSRRRLEKVGRVEKVEKVGEKVGKSGNV